MNKIKEAVKKSIVVEPHKYTQKEFLENRNIIYTEIVAKEKHERHLMAIRDHVTIIEGAIRSGKIIPPCVLQDYPYLMQLQREFDGCN